MKLPRLYPILDIGSVEARGLQWQEVATELLDAGVEVLQLRNKDGTPREILARAEWLSAQRRGKAPILIMNDRVDLAVLAGWTAIHLGHKDLPPEAARRMLPSGELILGVSTHDAAQVEAADRSTADYLAIGPVYQTASKRDTEAEVGLQGVREARSLTQKPLVAISGITLTNAARVIDAGADSVAVIGSLLTHPSGPSAAVRAFLEVLR